EYGLRCFPIYQTWARSVDYYSPEQGVTDCMTASYKAEEHGFKPGARIYFAVDYDAVDDEVTSYILPYFRSVRDEMNRLGSPYKIGVYGPRNACSRISAAGYADASFVSDMSSGFSGNLGYPMPENWSFDQIVTKTVGSGDGQIEIDNNIASGRDTGQGDFYPTPSEKLDIGFDIDLLPALLQEIEAYMASIGKPGGERIYTLRECLETIISHDAAITSGARRYRMRKALIQTSAFWEFCHYSIKDMTEDAGVNLYHTGIIPDWAKDFPVVNRLVDSSTGIAKISGRTCILARNNSIRAGLLEGTLLDATSDNDRWAMWQKVNQDNVFNLSTVPHMHIWGADGKAGDHAETPIRRPALDYDETEIYEVLRRYQGFGTEAEAHAKERMPLYAIFEKYNLAIRGL
ncbi:glycoside hydrolase domain-containing protein, partial [Streptomyces ardesiacus]